MKKEISIKKTSIINIIKSFIISFLLFLLLEHFGNFNYHFNTYSNYVVYESITENKIYSDSLFLIEYPEIEYLERYSQKFPYYFQATLEDILYITILSIILILIQLFNHKFKFKLI